jgi:anti-sigma factor RsiW
MHDIWTDRLSDYLDGEMERTERDALEAHLETCAECPAVLAELTKVRARARDRSELPVPEEIWPRLERAIASGGTATPVTRITRLPARVRSSFSLPEVLAACLVVAIVSGGTVFAVLRHAPARVATQPVRVAQRPERSGGAEERNGAVETTLPGPERSTPTTVVERPAGRTAVEALPAASRSDEAPPSMSLATETPHEEAISELRRALASNRDKLNPTTIRTLEANLAIIDLAIDQARRALAADSANTYVREHLAETMRRRVELLQRATTLASTSSLEGDR